VHDERQCIIVHGCCEVSRCWPTQNGFCHPCMEQQASSRLYTANIHKHAVGRLSISGITSSGCRLCALKAKVGTLCWGACCDSSVQQRQALVVTVGPTVTSSRRASRMQHCINCTLDRRMAQVYRHCLREDRMADERPTRRCQCL
jgi:hypothetical protein